MSPFPSYIHRTIQQQPHTQRSTGIIRQGGGLFSLRFGLSQLPINGSNPLVHLVSHSGTPSTTITPTPGSVLPGSTVTFTWSQTGGGTGATNVPYRYTGKEQDDSTGLYFYEARYYDPVLGRFISADTIVPNPSDPQSMNRYAYALNNPILYNDPSGHCAGLCVALVAAGIGATLGGLQAGLASDWDLESTLIGAGIGGAAGAVGGAIGGSIANNIALQGLLSETGALIAGGIAGGAVGGLTSGLLSRAAGYDTDIALGVAAGAAGGLVGGIAGGGFFDLPAFGMDPAGMAVTVIASAAGGAVSSTVSGSDPGMGALFAAGGAALSIGAVYAYETDGEQAQVELENGIEDAVNASVDQAGDVSPESEGIQIAAAFEFGTQEAADAFAEGAKFGVVGGATGDKALRGVQKIIEKFLGKGATGKRNPSGDTIFLSKDGNRRVRMDIKNTHKDPKGAHMHIEKRNSIYGKFKDAIPGTHRIYPGK